MNLAYDQTNAQMIRINTHLFIRLRFLLWVSSKASTIARACCALSSSASRRAVLSNLRVTKPH